MALCTMIIYMAARECAESNLLWLFEKMLNLFRLDVALSILFSLFLDVDFRLLVFLYVTFNSPKNF